MASSNNYGPLHPVISLTGILAWAGQELDWYTCIVTSGSFLAALEVYTYDNIEIGVFTSFQSCNFTGNSAEEAGGALGVGFHLPSASQQQVQPVEIKDW